VCSSGLNKKYTPNVFRAAQAPRAIGALLGIALSAIAGAILWLFVHPERPIPALAAAVKNR
jgi:hypothetical protein